MNEMNIKLSNTVKQYKLISYHFQIRIIMKYITMIIILKKFTITRVINDNSVNKSKVFLFFNRKEQHNRLITAVGEYSFEIKYIEAK